MERKIIRASEGMVLTDGNIFGKTIYLADGLSESDFHEITETEFEIMRTEEAEMPTE